MLGCEANVVQGAPYLGKYQHRIELGAELPHEACVVGVRLHCSLVAHCRQTIQFVSSTEKNRWRMCMPGLMMAKLVSCIED